MKRTELLKSLREAIDIIEQLKRFSVASDDSSGLNTLWKAEAYLQAQHTELRFVAKWLYWETYQKYRG